jgi:hypothetical protein
MEQVHRHRPQHGEHQGRITCPRCGAGLQFVIQSTGISRGQCPAAGCIKWTQ